MVKLQYFFVCQFSFTSCHDPLLERAGRFSIYTSHDVVGDKEVPSEDVID
jgi:hypothetical protein